MIAAALAVLAFSGSQYQFVLHWRHAGGFVTRMMSTTSLVVLWVVFAPVIFYVANRWALSHGNRLRNAIRISVFALVFSAARAVFDHALWLAVTGQRSATNEFFSTAWLLFHSELFTTVAVVVLANLLRIERENGRRAAVQSRLKASLTEARLHKLRGDVDPHFLFNALNTVAAMSEIDARGAQRVVGELTELLRASLATRDVAAIDLRDELEFIERYLAIQRARFGSSLSTAIVMEDDRLLRVSIPPLLLQPLVENAVLHGATQRREGGRVTVAISSLGSDLRLEVRDNGPGSVADATSAAGSVGIPNARERLRAIYGGRQSLTFRRSGEEFVAEIRIPLQWSAS